MAHKRLKTLSDIRRFLSAAILKYDKGEIDESKVKTISYSTNVLSCIVKDSSLEERVDKLERKAKDDNRA